MGRETKNNAVLFADVSESGVLYQRLGDATARSVVNACIEAMTAVVTRHDGAVVKTLGDAVLCIFPSADRAVLAACEMQSVVSRPAPGQHPVSIHIGVHYGPVLYEGGDVFGDTVNVAAYLTAVAVREQILTTEATEAALSPALKSGVRPVFSTVLKGSARESLVYQVLWKTDGADITQVNLTSSRTIPGDTGSLLVATKCTRIRIDQWKPSMRIGRSTECDIVVEDRYASRQHLTIRARGTRFYLVDHSINGTYVSFSGGDETHVLRGELLLDRSGELSLGRRRAEVTGETITFEYDRRSMYRI